MRTRIFLRLACMAAVSVSAVGSSDATPMVIGTREAPPFAMKTGDGEWAGLSIDLWREIASELQLEFLFREVSLREMVEGVAEGRLDAGVAALTLTAERERQVDFTHPFFSSGLGIAIRTPEGGMNWLRVLRGLISPAFLTVLAALGAVLLAAGVGIWVFERKKNETQFGGSTAEGLGSGFWWSAVTMTTVGYGDKSPVTLGGRLVALVWMFTSVIIISSFTAAIASSLTVSSLESPIRGPADLVRHQVGALAGSTASDFLLSRGIRVASHESLEEAMEALREGLVDAVVHDRPILQYLARGGTGLTVLPHSFQRQDYGYSLPPGSPLRQEINVALLERISSAWWQAEQQRYFGQE